MLSEIHPKIICPALIKDGEEASHKENCVKNRAPKDLTDGSVQGKKPCCHISPF